MLPACYHEGFRIVLSPIFSQTVVLVLLENGFFGENSNHLAVKIEKIKQR